MPDRDEHFERTMRVPERDSRRLTHGPGRVRATLHEEFYARFRCYDLSNEEFRRYRESMDGAEYVRSLKAQVATLDRVPAILVRLRKAGLSVGPGDMDPRLRTALQERATATDWLDLDAVKHRIMLIEEKLAKKDEHVFPYQREGAIWLARKHGALLADDMGLGKTVQTLIALPANAAVVVVCPSGMKGTWLGQVKRWRPDLTVTILKGRTSFRWPKPGEVLICNYDILPDIHDREGVGGRRCIGFLDPRPCPGCRDRLSFAGERGVTKTRTDHEPTCDGYLQADIDDPRPCPGCHPFLQLAPRGMVLVLDEAQNLKNRTSKRHAKAVAIAERVRHKDGYVWSLTGTPLENEASELWAVLRAGTIHRDAFGSRERFEEVFNAQRTEGGGIAWGVPGAEIRRHLKRVMFRRLLDDVQPQLPPKLRVQNIVNLDKASYRRIDEFLRNTGKSVEQIVRLLELEQIRFEDMSSVRAAIATAKIPRVLEVVEDFEERRVPVVVFSDHRAPIEALSKRPGWVHIIGGEGSERMNRAVDEFQNGFLAGPLDPYVVDELNVRRRADPSRRIVYPRGIAVTVYAGGTGITLTRAAHMVFVDRAWNPQVNIQAEARCRRIGSERHKSIEVMDIVSNHALDARVTEVIVRKTKLFEASINASADRRVVGGMEAEILRQLREEHEAIAAGRVARRGPKNDREREAFAALQETNETGGSTLVFDDPRDAKIADDLAEQSDRIGLSDKQWSLAIVIVRKGRRHDALPARPEPEQIVVRGDVEGSNERPRAARNERPCTAEAERSDAEERGASLVSERSDGEERGGSHEADRSAAESGEDDDDAGEDDYVPDFTPILPGASPSGRRRQEWAPRRRR